MAGHAGEALKEIERAFFDVRQGDTPGVRRLPLTNEASKDGSLPARFKELVAVAIAVNQGCEDCIVFHLANASKHGASRQELVEVLGVAVEMGGGPGSVYAAKSAGGF